VGVHNKLFVANGIPTETHSQLLTGNDSGLVETQKIATGIEIGWKIIASSGKVKEFSDGSR
jgi:hypothetical protein